MGQGLGPTGDNQDELQRQKVRETGRRDDENKEDHEEWVDPRSANGTLTHNGWNHIDFVKDGS
jgi:hypothetical protein